MTNQQRLLLEQMQRMYEVTDRTGEHIDSRGLWIVVSSCLLSMLFGLNMAVFGLPAIAFSAICSAVVGLLCVFLLLPRKHELPGKADWDSAFDGYVNREVDDAYNQVLANLIEAIKTNQAENAKASTFASVAAATFAVQCIGVCVLLVWKP